MQPVANEDAAGEISSWWRTVELCLPCHGECGAASFRPAGAETLDADWERWVGGVYLPVLRPALTGAQDAARTSDLRHLTAIDARTAAALSGEASAGSLAAGRHLLFSCGPPQGARLLQLFAGAAREDDSTGHLATAFAVRGHVFHVPGVQLAGAFLLAEGVLGADSAGVTLPAGRAIALLHAALELSAAEPALHVLAV
jgi:hypothetical protein